MTGSRPARVVFVTGTGTGIGKTWWAAAVARELRTRGVSVAARKPVQSFETGTGATDAEVLAAATGATPESVCPRHRWYEVAMAPPMAAGLLGRPAFTISDLVAEVEWPDGVDVGIVEGAGGPRSPLTGDGDNVDLAAGIRPDTIVLVADAGLGTINAVRLAVPLLAPLAPVTVVLNRYEDQDLHRANRDWLRREGGLDVVRSVAELADRLAPARG